MVLSIGYKILYVTTEVWEKVHQMKLKLKKRSVNDTLKEILK